mmetsp:Transcript_54039/g.141364  ORF Transcript_54039/g.141364 Transcript_54039/m.141364 type:complete len:203 (+) Transcript_54039:299-907(+)
MSAIAWMISSTVNCPLCAMPNRTIPSKNSAGSSTPTVPRFTARKRCCKLPRLVRSASSTPKRMSAATISARGASSPRSARKPQRTGCAGPKAGAAMAGSNSGLRQRPSKTPCSNRTCSIWVSSFPLSIDRNASAARRSCAVLLRTASEITGPAVRLRRCRCSLPSVVAGRTSPGSLAQRAGVCLQASQLRGGMWMGSIILKP